MVSVRTIVLIIVVNLQQKRKRGEKKKAEEKETVWLQKAQKVPEVHDTTVVSLSNLKAPGPALRV